MKTFGTHVCISSVVSVELVDLDDQSTMMTYAVGDPSFISSIAYPENI